jgi:hypothetical protein
MSRDLRVHLPRRRSAVNHAIELPRQASTSVFKLLLTVLLLHVVSCGIIRSPPHSAKKCTRALPDKSTERSRE